MTLIPLYPVASDPHSHGTNFPSARILRAMELLASHPMQAHITYLLTHLLKLTSHAVRLVHRCTVDRSLLRGAVVRCSLLITTDPQLAGR